MIEIVIGILPVFIFLMFLIYLDSFKLVNAGMVASAIIWGVISAGAAYLVNNFLLLTFIRDMRTYSIFMAPLIEEFIKAAFIIILFYRNKIGFMIDAAILGFAAGAGFSLVENLYYLNTIVSNNLLIWIIRGFGTAIMHGGCTALFSIIIMSTSNWRHKTNAILIGILPAIIIHSLYNSFLFSPIISTAIIMIAVPVIISFFFNSSENNLRKWLEIEMDTELKMLEMIKKGNLSNTRSGKFLLSIKDRFVQEVVLDIMCYIRIYLELSIRAKTNLMLKECGFPVRNDDVKDSLNELRFLQKNIGKAGLLAISPILRMNQKDIWKLNQLT
jgi:RsiW-degrading membrane proteinase PrsW (M82 family)